MKIGILTHELKTNYGCLLQNYALQQILLRLGQTPMTINYYVSTPTKVIILSFISRIIRKLRGERIPLRGWTSNGEYLRISKHIRRFIYSHIITTKPISLSKLDHIQNYDFKVIVVGSDQVWRGNGRPVEKFYLKDITNNDITKIAYAASFGTDEWTYTDIQTQNCRNLIKQFSAVSVREVDGMELCKRYLGVSAKFVLDPTLLLNKSDYVNLFINYIPMFNHNNKSLMTYILDKTAKKQQVIDDVCNRLGLTSNEVMPKKIFGKENSSNFDDYVFPPVEEWLRGFNDCEYVVTDSFHGTVFAIIFNKPFVTIANSKRGNSRFESLLGLLELKKRMITDVSEVENVLNQNIDWNRVNKDIHKYQDISIRFLVDALT